MSALNESLMGNGSDWRILKQHGRIFGRRKNKAMRTASVGICGAIFGILLLGKGAYTQDSTVHGVSDIEGAWILVEWHEEGRVLRPPDIGGAYSLTGGQVTWIVFRKTDSGERSEQCYGMYEMGPGSFEYSYDRCSESTVESNKVSFQSGPWSTPPFSVLNDKGKLVLIDENNEFGFELAGDRLTYTQNGSPLRVYQRFESIQRPQQP